MTDQTKTPETMDTLRQKLRVAERIKQAAIDCTKSWDNILDELVWERPDIDAHEIPAEHLQTMIARYPHYASDLTDFAKRWNSDKPLSDDELNDIEVDEKEVKRSMASCLLMLKWAMRIRKAEAERDELRLWAEKRDADCASAWDERDAARDALRELNEATSAIYPSFEAGADAQLAWSDRIDCARQRARAVLEGKS